MRKDETQREGCGDVEKIDVIESVRVKTGGVGRDGDGGRDGERMEDGEDDAERRRVVTLTNSTGGGGGVGGGGGLKALSEVASVRASSNGPTTALTGSARGARISDLLISPTFGGGRGVVVPEGLTETGGDVVVLCQYMGSSSCSSNSTRSPC